MQDSDAADIGQEVFRAVARAVGHFVPDKERGSFRSWLRTIAANKIKDLARVHQREPRPQGGDGSVAFFQNQPTDLPPEDSESDAGDEKLIRRQAIELMLEECDERTRQVFWRVVAEQHTPRQVAQDLQMSVNAVYLIKSRLLRRIREEFEHLVDLDPVEASPGEVGPA